MKNTKNQFDDPRKLYTVDGAMVALPNNTFVNS